MMVKEGDKVQWTINGADQFVEPRSVVAVSDCGEYCFVDGSNTGLPVAQITVVKPPKAVVQHSNQSEVFTFFWRGPFSQWHLCQFQVDGVWYNCAEQWMMASKARVFGDERHLKKIMEEKDPSFQKKLGKLVSPYNDEKWNGVARQVVYKGNHAKFTQNKTLLSKLLATTGELVEASPYDQKWGIGLAESDPRSRSRATWRGTNWLGEVLTQLREDLKKSG